MIKTTLYIITFLNLLFGDFLKPEDNMNFNFTRILFEWQQVKDAIAYDLQIQDLSNNQEDINIIDSSLAGIITIFDWDNSYKVKIRPVFQDNNFGDWIDSIMINIDSLPDNYYDFTPEINLIDDENDQDAFTIIHQQIIDKTGYPIYYWQDWNEPELFVVTRFLENGELIGILRGGGLNFNGIRYKLNGDIMWESPIRVQREIIPFETDGEIHYFGLVKEIYENAIPHIEPWQSQFEEAGLDSVMWYSDAIVEWDQNGNELWRWSCKDNFSFEDLDPNFSLNAIELIISGENQLDWTHCNSIYFDSLDNSLYLSTRHLSRITKISYPSGEMLWNMGKEFPSGDVSFGYDLGLSGQHAFKKLNNGNFMMYDNGNFNIPQLSRGLEISIDETDFTTEIVWEYYLPSDLYTHKWGDCDRLDNGNSLITAGGGGHITEVDSLNNVVWQIDNMRPSYRSEQIFGLYPLAFSVMIPNFEGDMSNPIVYLPIGQPAFNLKIFNEGYLDYEFSYSIDDDMGWFDSGGSVEIESNSSATVEVYPSVNESEIENNIIIEVCPTTNYDVECKIIELVGVSYSSDLTVYNQQGWNLVSLPFEVEDALYTTLFPEAIEGTLYSYNGSYVSESGLISGKGYWLRFPNAGDNMITGTLITELTLSLSAGWNLISGTSEVSTIIDPSSILIQGTLFGYNGAYYNAIELEPGEAYWVRANADGEISIISTGNTTPVSESSKLK